MVPLILDHFGKPGGVLSAKHGEKDKAINSKRLTRRLRLTGIRIVTRGGVRLTLATLTHHVHFNPAPTYRNRSVGGSRRRGRSRELRFHRRRSATGGRGRVTRLPRACERASIAFLAHLQITSIISNAHDFDLLKFGLNRGRMDFMFMEEILDRIGRVEIIAKCSKTNMNRRDYLHPGETPHVEFVHRNDALHLQTGKGRVVALARGRGERIPRVVGS
jgi:hypothetical protein